MKFVHMPHLRLATLSMIGVVLTGCHTMTAKERWAAEEEREQLEKVTAPEGDYWAARVAYPTGRFEPLWMVAAAIEDKKIAKAIPAGEKTYRRSANSPLTLNPNQFTLLGPKPLNDTEFGFGHVSGRANALLVDPVDTTIAYLASDGGGVWKSTNCCSASTTWAIKTDNIAEISGIAIGDITIDPTNHNTVYAATGDLRYGSFSFGSAGVLKSTDQGETWTVLGTSVFNPLYGPSAGGFPQYQSVSKVVVDPNNGNNLIAGTKTGMFVSNDAGANWTGPCYTNTFTGPVGAQRQDITGLIAQNISGSTRLFAAVGTRGTATPVQPDLDKNGANGVYRSTLPATGCPAVASWTLINNGWPAGTGNGTPSASLGRIELAVAPTDPQTLYAMAADVTTKGVLGVWKTVNGGDTWTQTATSASFGGCSNAGTQMWYDSGLTVSPTDANTVFASTVDLMRSTNGATSFTNLTCGYSTGTTHVDHHARTFIGNDPTRMLIGSDGGVYYVPNATAASPTFTPINDSIATIEFYSGDITGNFATATTPGASGGAQDNGSSAVQWSGGSVMAKQWESTGSGDGTFTRIEPVLGLRWYYQSQNGNMQKSTTGPFGATSSASGAWSGDRKSFLMPYEIYKHGVLDAAGSGCTTASGCSRMIAGTYRLWETLTGAIPSSSWTAKTGDLTKNNLILGADNRSFINQVAYSFTDPTIAIVGTNDGYVQYVFGLGSAGAASAVNVSNAIAQPQVLPNRPIMDVVTDAVNPLIGYAVAGGFNENTPTTPGHVFQVTCTANCATYTWADKSGNLPNIPVNAVMVNPLFPQQVYAGSDWGLYFTNNINVASPVWMRHEGMPHAMIWDLVVDRGFTTMAVFTRSRGAWAWPLPSAPITDVIFANGFEP